MAKLNDVVSQEGETAFPQESQALTKSFEEKMREAREKLLEEDASQVKTKKAEQEEGWISSLADLYKEERDLLLERKSFEDMLKGDSELEVIESRIEDALKEINSKLEAIKEFEAQIKEKHPSAPRLATLRSAYRNQVAMILFTGAIAPLPVTFKEGLEAEFVDSISHVIEQWLDIGFIVPATDDHLESPSCSWDGKEYMIHPDHRRDKVLWGSIESLDRDCIQVLKKAKEQEKEEYRKKIAPFVLGSPGNYPLLSSDQFKAAIFGNAEVKGYHIIPIKREKEGRVNFYGRLLVEVDVRSIKPRRGEKGKAKNRIELKALKTDERLVQRIFGPRQNDPHGEWKGVFSLFFDANGRRGIEEIRHNLIQESIFIYLDEMEKKSQFNKTLNEFVDWEKVKNPITFQQLEEGSAGICPVSIEDWRGMDKIVRKRRFQFVGNGEGGYTIQFPDKRDERDTICAGLPKPGEYSPIKDLERSIIQAIRFKNERFELGWVVERAEVAHDARDLIAVLEEEAEGAFVVYGNSYDDEKKPLAFVFKKSGKKSGGDTATLELLETLIGSPKDTEKRLRMKPGVYPFSEVPDQALYFLLAAYCRKKNVDRGEAPEYLLPRRFRKTAPKIDVPVEDDPTNKTIEE